MERIMQTFGYGVERGPVGRRVRIRRDSDQNELIQRYAHEKDNELPEDWNENLPFGGKVYLARRKKADPWWCIALQVFSIVMAVSLAGYAWWYFDHLHFRVAHFYATLGYPHAQHVVGHKYLDGKGVEKHEDKAMEFFRKAADQGHPHAAYNLAVGYLQGIKTDVKPGWKTQKICLPDSCSMTCQESTTAYIAGWGKTSFESTSASKILQTAVIEIGSLTTCQSQFTAITDVMICAGNLAGGVDTCHGDSGGPLMTVENGVYILCGVTSFGYECARPNFYGVYARVCSVIDWIQANSDA